MKDGFLKNSEWATLGYSLGFAGGVFYSFKNGLGFWKGAGVSILFGIASGAIIGNTAKVLTK